MLILWFDMTSSRFTWHLRMISFINERKDEKKQIEIGGAGTGGCRGGADGDEEEKVAVVVR